MAAVLLVVALTAAGVAPELAAPRSLDELAAGIGQGLSAVPNVRVPYGGADEWTRIVIVLGGGALVGLGALLAFAPRRDGRLGFPPAAAVALGVLYLVPVMQHDGEHQFLAGALFALLLALFLWLDRVERDAAPLAAGAVAVAVLAALVVAPRVDADRPLVDYEQLAQSVASPSTRYGWDHDYGPLQWPRDGRELLRIRARQRTYWKAANLVTFDGRRWRRSHAAPAIPLDGGLQNVHLRWRQTLRVAVRGLRSTQFIAAGTTLGIADSSRTPVERDPGAFATLKRPLRRGNAYRATVYAPRPPASALRAAEAVALPSHAALTSIALPTVARGAPDAVARGAQDAVARGAPPADAVAVIPTWGRGEPSPRSLAALAASPYRRAYELARRLRARSATPYDFMRAIERHLGRDYTYSERPQPSSVPLAEFLFGERRGYCQQFAGAMALLLRLGGVPARVAAGFSPGSYDATRREYVVRDLDAHSWVEVFFAGIGWVTRDPTPSASPARSQLADLREAQQAAAGAGSGAGSAPAPADRQPGGASARPGERERFPLAAPPLGLAGMLAAIALLLAARHRRRSRAPTQEPVAQALDELQRALRRSGCAPAARTTLTALASRYRESTAGDYVRTLSEARYGYGTVLPTPAQRAGLRREIASGRGLRGRLRAWWALPPRTLRRRHAPRLQHPRRRRRSSR